MVEGKNHFLRYTYRLLKCSQENMENINLKMSVFYQKMVETISKKSE